MHFRLFVVAAIFALAFGLQDDIELVEHLWVYSAYIAESEYSTMANNFALYSSTLGNSVADQVHGDTIDSGLINRYSTQLRKFQQIMNYPNRAAIPQFNVPDGVLSTEATEQLACPTRINCSQTDNDHKIRRLDGRCNNPINVLWGSTFVKQERFDKNDRGTWESVANSSIHEMQENVFNNTAFLGFDPDFKEPVLIKLFGGGIARIAGFDRNGKETETTMDHCNGGCSVDGAIFKVKETKNCPEARFQLHSNVLVSDTAAEGCQYKVSYYHPSFLMTIDTAGSELRVFNVDGTLDGTFTSDQLKLSAVPGGISYIWMNIGDEVVTFTEGTEYIDQDPRLTADITLKRNQASVSVSGTDSSVQFVSKYTFGLSTDSNNSPVSLDNIAFTYIYYTFRIGVRYADQEQWGVDFIGRAGSDADGVVVSFRVANGNMTVSDTKGQTTSVVMPEITDDFETALGETIKKYKALWFAWYGDELYCGHGNIVARNLIVKHDYNEVNWWFKMGDIRLSSAETNQWVADIGQEGIPRYSSWTTAEPLPSALDVALTMHRRTTEEVEWSNKLTMAAFSYGQFLDHDIVATPLISEGGHAPICCQNGASLADGYRSACFNIDVTNNLLTPSELAPFNTTETECIDFVRSATQVDCEEDSDKVNDKLRNPMNSITGYIDASNVYGSDDKTLALLRVGSTCFLKVGFNDELPVEVVPGEACAAPPCNFAGDFRSQEMPLLASMHTLFVREHNRLATILNSTGGYDNDDDCFEAVRAIVIAEIQVITEDYFASFMNEDVLKKFKFSGDRACRYNEDVNGGIVNDAAMIYRMGHTWISDGLGGGVDGADISGDIKLANNFFVPIAPHSTLGASTNTLATNYQNACPGTDKVMENSVMETLFTSLTSVPNSLAALNTQRARDHGNPTFSGIRDDLKLAPVDSFSDLTGLVETATIDKLKFLYDSVYDVDLFTAALVENPMEGSSVGEIINNGLGDQLGRFRRGDRFWYTCLFVNNAIKSVQDVTLGKIICDNGGLDDEYEMQTNIFQQQDDTTNPLIKCSDRDALNMDLFSNANNGGQVVDFGADVFSTIPAKKNEDYLKDLLSLLVDRLEEDLDGK